MPKPVPIRADWIARGRWRNIIPSVSVYVDIFSPTESGQWEKEIKKVKMCVHIGFGPSTLQIQGVWLALGKCVRVCVQDLGSPLYRMSDPSCWCWGSIPIIPLLNFKKLCKRLHSTLHHSKTLPVFILSPSLSGAFLLLCSSSHLCPVWHLLHSNLSSQCISHQYYITFSLSLAHFDRLFLPLHSSPSNPSLFATLTRCYRIIFFMYR